MWTLFQLNLRQSGRPIAEEAKDKKEGNDGGNEGAANVKICALLLNNSANGPIHRPHAVADLNQSETRNAAIFSADFCLTRWYHKQRLGTHWLSAVLSFWVQSPQQNGCMGAYRVINLEQFPVRISTDKAPTPLTKFGICSFFFFCHSPFFLCTALSDSWRFNPF